MANTQRTLEDLQRIYNKTIPHNMKLEGDNRVLLLLELSHQIVLSISKKAITPEVLQRLTEDNCHTLREACELVTFLRREVTT